MPSLKDIRKRIGSVRSTQQITRAMKLVAAARLKRATEAALAARPYALALDEVLGRLAREEVSHPLMERREAKRTRVLVVASDRGLCGSFNGGLLRRTEEWLDGRSGAVEVEAWGKKARDFFRPRRFSVVRTVLDRNPKEALEQARASALELAALYEGSQIDEAWIAYNRFASVMTQKPELLRLLPVSAAEPEAQEASLLASSFAFEPDRATILAALLPLYLETRLHQVLIESQAGELASRMRAMDAATTNAGELISKLTLKYNRARQAAITKELVEIIGGAEAL